MGLNHRPRVASVIASRAHRFTFVAKRLWRACGMALALTIAVALPARGEVKTTDVWLDVDTATGITDVDDGLMLIQCFHSPELNVRGVSVVFGNTTLKRAVPIAEKIVARFGPRGLTVSPGAASAKDLGRETPAASAIAAALRERPLTILAVGPVTNIGTLVKLHPELHSRIERIVMVAARRAGQRFVGGEKQRLPHRDFNFELDPTAMQVILDTRIPLVFAPWEVSSKLWINREDLAALARTGGSGQWIAETSAYWISLWEARITSRGFNPFDTLAAAWVTHPQWIKAIRVEAHIEQAPDDRVAVDRGGDAKMKPYLVVRPCDAEGSREILYCYEPKPELKPMLLKRLSGSGSADSSAEASSP